MTSTEKPNSPVTGSPRRHSLAWSVALSAVAVVIWIGSQRTSMGPAAGDDFAGKTPVRAVQSAQTFRLGTFNMHGGKGPDGRVDLLRVAETVRGTDLVAINEVRNDFPISETNQAEWLGIELKQRWLYAPTEQRWWGQLFGNGVITSLAIENWQRLPLVRQKSKTYRNATLLQLSAGNARVNVLVTHLDRVSAADRSAQLQSVTSWFLALEPPVVLLGDLNTTRDDPAMKKLLATSGVVDALAQLKNDPPRRIDWILARGFKVLDVGMVDRGASDHPFYWADVQVP
jgi:endonuclease/exonuclease/phosphatase family metal-dependent hydrolase